jgi:hypothetical protein
MEFGTASNLSGNPRSAPTVAARLSAPAPSKNWRLVISFGDEFPSSAILFSLLEFLHQTLAPFEAAGTLRCELGNHGRHQELHSSTDINRQTWLLYQVFLQTTIQNLDRKCAITM